MILTVLIEPGHGKDTPGKRSPELNGVRLFEWKFNREVVDKIIPLLETNNIKVVNLVPEEHDVSLKERYTRVNNYVKLHPNEKCVFISIHGNAAGNGGWMNAQGWSAWTTKGLNKSDILAECLYDAAEPLLKERKIRVNKTDGDKDWEANFTVIKGTTIPSVLTENFFYDNKDDMQFMMSEEGQERIAMLHLYGILKYFKNN